MKQIVGILGWLVGSAIVAGAAEAPLRSAVPLPDLWSLSERIDAIYADDEPSGEPGGSA